MIKALTQCVWINKCNLIQTSIWGSFSFSLGRGYLKLPQVSSHAIGPSELIDLCVIKIKLSFVHKVHWDHMNTARNADQAARRCEGFVYSIVKITRSYDLSSMADTFLWPFFLPCAFWVLIGWADKLLLQGCFQCITVCDM